ncbi:rRNA N-glycosidase [Rhynchospora pubera]|uniref:rRNA N-glycosidase n=1 Tax=Rhynchospora pubera TaxID=906938 RepID=A0AAV8DHX2_9POAL|nr:rRNA N-glycosidase [Rhynchospora pubera]KAJ4765926.1 rRNA N-glycosidase [Rhynchospora pubera]
MSILDIKAGHPEEAQVDFSTSTESEMIKKRALVEVFSIRYIGEERATAKEYIHGIIFLKASNRKYAIYQDRGDGEPSHINSEGHFILTDPDCPVEVDDTLIIYPRLFSTICMCDRRIRVTLWQRSPTDVFMEKTFDTKHGAMRVNFAVYSDGLEAKLEVSFRNFDLNKWQERDEPIQIYGTIKASNSVVNHSEAKSTFFYHITSQECITIDPRSKSLIVIPRESILSVETSLYIQRALRDEPISTDSFVFLPRPGSSSTLEQMTLVGNLGTINVKITWSN